jgi:hypothetical protein
MWQMEASVGKRLNGSSMSSSRCEAFLAATELFDPKHNPLWAVGPTGDGATKLLRFWQRVDPDTGTLVHDFTDLPSLGGRGALPEINLGERAFEILMACQMAAGELETTWFERRRSTPVTEIPAHWPEGYRRLVERRIALIEQDRNVGLIERPEYKRRWNQEPWEAQDQRALRGWLLDRLETSAYWTGLELHPSLSFKG